MPYLWETELSAPRKSSGAQLFKRWMNGATPFELTGCQCFGCWLAAGTIRAYLKRRDKRRKVK